MAEKTGSKGHDAEDSVRRFLLMLSDPDSLRDEVAVQQLRGKLEGTSDPLERLSLFSAIERAENLDVQGIRSAFHRDARVFAEAHGISASAFAAMGVSRDDLRAAGLLGQSPRAALSSAGPRRAARRSSVDDVAAVVPSDPFTLRQLEELSGASTLTVKKTVDGLLAAGTLTMLEPDTSHSGPGRAPRRYVRS